MELDFKNYRKREVKELLWEAVDKDARLVIIMMIALLIFSAVYMICKEVFL